MLKKIDSFFEISKRGSTLSTEIWAGLATFFAMSYILAANPAILSSVGIDKSTLITITALAAALGSLCMALFANLPVALAPAMGANSYFAFVVCSTMGIDWRSALALVFYNGIFFLIISLAKIREKIVLSVPTSVRVGLQAGIGMFIAYLGLQSSKIIIPDKFTVSGIGNLIMPECLLGICGLLLVAVLISRKYKSAVVTSIAIITIISFFLYDSSGKPLAQFPEKLWSLPNSISSTFLQLDFLFPFREPLKAIPIIFVLLIMDMFDTIATLIATGRASGLMDKNANMPKMTNALSADATATIVGALLGTSTTGAYVESSAGIEAGGRTGLTSVIVALLFFVSLFFAPIICCVPQIAVAPVMIIVGVLMMRSLVDLDFSKTFELIPAIVSMLIIAFSFRISLGFSFGIIAYVLLAIASGNRKLVNVPVVVMLLIIIPFLYLLF
ncbi:MAG: NCS2 family permease [Verrucomicrobiaceae bacterium]|nr:NCS2 family permease [Verrucomicrobiaceae bacterium]